MEVDPQVPPYDTSDRTSFARPSVVERWPVILTGAIDDVHRSTGSASDETQRDEGKKIVEALAKLKYEMQHDRQLTPLDDDGQPDIKAYNEELERLGNPTWHKIPWLFSECYLYRRMSTLFSMSSKWKSYDVFARQKKDSFKSSKAAITELASKYKSIVTELRNRSQQEQSSEQLEEAQRLLFIEMCEICLWGNKTDLSLLTNLTHDDLQKLQGSKARKDAEANILVNDLGAAYTILRQAQKEKPSGERRVDIVLDNAGFELYVDLILAGFLLSAGLATNIVLHPKSIPWFVSDVVPNDFGAMLNVLANPGSFFDTTEEEKTAGRKDEKLSENEVADMEFLFQDWQQLYVEGQFIIRPHRFWTMSGGFWRLPTAAPELLADLRQSELVIFKGDLNYRKLVGDVMWDPTTPFSQAIGPLAQKGEGFRVLSLRTSKADVIVGLPQGKDEELRAKKGGGGDSGCRKWAWSGDWAVCQFSDGL